MSPRPSLRPPSPAGLPARLRRATAFGAPAGPPGRRRRATAVAFLAAVALLTAAAPAAAWTPKTQVTIAREGARMAPHDLYRLIQRHPRELDEGAVAPFEDGEPARHTADGGGTLERVIGEEVERAIGAIQGHLPFERVVYQLGVVSHFVADANNPLNASAADASEGVYFADYLRYLESAEPRLPVLFYGVYPGLEERGSLAPLLDATFARGRQLYPLVGLEYRRIGYESGVGRFDDRSTAFGIASLAFSHAVSDVGLVLRYIWVRAGGADFRTKLPARGEKLVRLPRLADGPPPGAVAGR